MWSLFKTEKPMKKTAVIGIGSVLKGDDGLGIRVIDELEKEPISKGVSLRSGDISGLDLLKHFAGFERVIIIDAADMKQKPGTIKTFKPSQIKKSDFRECNSTHGITLLETLALAEKLNISPEVIIVGVQPEDTSFKLGLSRSIEENIPYIVDKIKTIL
jgi:hydrogenase maturation protease